MPRNLERGRFFNSPFRDRTEKNSFKLEKNRFRLFIRKNFFTIKVLQDWNRLLRKIIDDSSLEIFSVMLDWALIKQIKLMMSLLIAGGWTK